MIGLFASGADPADWLLADTASTLWSGGELAELGLSYNDS